MATEWRELYEREYARLLRALVAMGGDSQAAEDSAQEAFVKAHLHGLEGIERPGAWLLVTATRELFRHRRRLRVERERWAQRPAIETSAAFDVAADRADLLSALRQLPERQRAVVVARFYYGLSYEEIARLFVIRSGTVGATLHQALTKLRQLHIAGKLSRGAMR